jgi:hypothetical protein
VREIKALNEGNSDALTKLLSEYVFVFVPVLQGLCELDTLDVLVFKGVFDTSGLRLSVFSDVDVFVPVFDVL